MTFALEKLTVYQKAIDFADAICTLMKSFPRGYFFLADQINRTTLSIAANVTEGNGRLTKPDRKNFFDIARGSVQKCVPLVKLAKIINGEMANPCTYEHGYLVQEVVVANAHTKMKGITCTRSCNDRRTLAKWC